MTKKITAFVLSLLLILPSVFGCSARKVEAYSSRPAATVLGGANFGGSTVKVLISERSRDTGDVDISASELFGVTVSTEGYYCRRTAEDELGVIIEYASAPSVLDALTADAAADMGSYSIAYPTLSEYSAALEMGLLTDLLTVNASAFSADYFDSSFAEAATVNGKLYAVLESGSLSAFRSSFVTVASPSVMGEDLTARLKTLVLDGNFTIDAQNEIVAEAGSYTEEKKIYGLGSDRGVCADSYLSAFDLSLTERDGEGRVVLPESFDILESAYEKIHDLIVVNPYTYINEGDGGTEELAELFFDGTLAMATLEISRTETNLTGSDYLILPLPKYSEEQRSYSTYASDVTPAVIPRSAPDLASAAAVLESLSAKGDRYITPVYLDRITLGRYTKSAETARMTDLAVKKRGFDTVTVYSELFGGVPELIFSYPLKEGETSNRGTALLSMKTVQRGLPGFKEIFE